MAGTTGFRARARQPAAREAAPKPTAVVQCTARLAAAVDPVEAALVASTAGIHHLLKPVAVAERLRASERRPERWRGTGEGSRYISLSRKTVRYDVAEVAGFIAGRIKASTAQ